MSTYLLGSGSKFVIFIIIAPVITWLVMRFFRSRGKDMAISDPQVIFPVILITAVLVKILHTLFKHFML